MTDPVLLVMAIVVLAALLIWRTGRHARFCRHCGKGLIRRQILLGYDEHSGERRSWDYWACPDARSAPGMLDDGVAWCDLPLPDLPD